MKRKTGNQTKLARKNALRNLTISHITIGNIVKLRQIKLNLKRKARSKGSLRRKRKRKRRKGLL